MGRPHAPCHVSEQGRGCKAQGQECMGGRCRPVRGQACLPRSMRWEEVTALGIRGGAALTGQPASTRVGDLAASAFEKERCFAVG